jgi:hypothetical protein
VPEGGSCERCAIVESVLVPVTADPRLTIRYIQQEGIAEGWYLTRNNGLLAGPYASAEEARCHMTMPSHVEIVPR